MRAPLVLLLLLAAAFAGCSSPPQQDAPADTTASEAPVPGGSVGIATPAHVDLSWSGRIPYGAWACDATVQECRGLPDGSAYGVNHDAEADGFVQGGNLTLTWTAVTPLTQRMAIGLVAVVPGCADCNETHLGKDLDGTSPLAYPIPAGQVLAPGTVLRIWVYSADYHAAGPDFVGTSGQQDFQVAGGIDLLR